MEKCFWGLQTHFSVGQSILDPEDAIKRIAELGYTAVALADVMSVSAMITVAKACKKHGLSLVTGCTLRVLLPGTENRYYFPKVYVKEASALERLYGLLSGAQKNYDDLFITQEEFLAYLSDDVLVTSGSAMGLFSHAFPDVALDALVHEIGSRVGRNGFVPEVVGVASPMYARANARALCYSVDHDYPAILNPLALYQDPEDHDARDVAQAIVARRKIDMGTMRWFPDRGRYLKDLEAVKVDFEASINMAGDILGGSFGHLVLMASWRGTDPSWYRWEKSDPCLPKMAPDEFLELKNECRKRFEARIMRPVFGYQPDKSLIPQYIERLKYELDVLGEKGFAGYFLLVADLVQWSKDNGIIVGPGRGSVGGSLVAFIMGITEVDPIRFNLLFERFINPGRKDLPDADLDFMSERRHEVIEYLKAKYGEDHVAGISNYNTLQGAGALRDVGKALLLSEKDYECSKLVPKEHGQPVGLKEAAERVADIEAFKDKHPEAFDISCRLEGVLRALGQHAAGVVVADRPLVTRSVVAQRGVDKCINWDKRVSEEQGLVKIDILGLSNLDIIERAFNKIEADYGRKVDILEIPLDDAKVLKAFAEGNTIGVFQFESSGMRKLLKDLAKGGPLTFEELSAAMALYRPGPLDSGMLDDYVSIRQGITTPYYDHDNMEPALAVTGGVVIYQEQVMQLARDLAGFTLQEADDLRKAMGKKDKAMMAEQRDKWVEGCVSHSSMLAAVAGALFDKIEAFAGYGFNRSHSIEYAIISFVSMWLKVYYPLQFYAASLEILGEDKLFGLLQDAAKQGIRVLPPDINQSDKTFKRDRGSNNLLAPFNRLKGLSDLTTDAILEARAAGPFTSKSDFLSRVVKRRCNVRHCDILERVGAFASITPGSPSSGDPSRTKDLLELMPGLVSANVHVGRAVVWDDHTKAEISKVIAAARTLDSTAINPRASKKIKAMVITDAATKQEHKVGMSMHGSNGDYVRQAIKDAGGVWSSGFYYTSLCKVPKRGQRLSGEELREWGPLLRKEIEALKPPVIIACGSEIARFLIPDLTGPISDTAGKVVYNKELDANIVVGLTPGMVYVDPTKAETLKNVFVQALELM